MAGDTAESIDESDTMSHWLPIVFAFVLGLSFVLLTIAFRSLVVAAKAIGVNLLSVGAAYGLLVLCSSRASATSSSASAGRRDRGVGSAVPVRRPLRALDGLPRLPDQPYRERFAQTGDNRDAIVHGVSSTGRIITGAALIIVAVFSGFARATS